MTNDFPKLNSWLDYRTVWRWHFYAGLICIPFVIILSITGSLYLFKPQIEAWNDAPYDHLEVQGQPASAADQIRAALAAVPDSTLNAYELPTASNSAARVLVNHQGETIRVYVHPESLAILNQFPENERFMRLLFRIHGELLMGNRGSNLVELAASWTIIMIVTGVYLWWPRQAKGWGGIAYPRLRGGSRMFWRDIHSVTGFWISGLALGLLLSGLPWAKFWGDYFKTVRRLTNTAVAKQEWSNNSEQSASKPAKESASDGHGGHGRHGSGGRSSRDTPTPKDLTAVDRIVATVTPLNLQPPVLIAPPSRAGDDWTAKSNTANRPQRVNLVVNGVSGEILKRDGFEDKHFLDKIVAIGIAAHEGQLFGWPNQLLGLFTAIGLVLLCVSGVIMWWRRRAPGELGAPKAALNTRISLSVVMLIVLLGVYLPLFGVSLLVVLLIERLILRRIKPVREWLGLPCAKLGLSMQADIVTTCLVFAVILVGCGGARPVVGGTDGTLRVAGVLFSETQVTIHQLEGSQYQQVGFAVTDSEGAFQLVTNGAKGPLRLEQGKYSCTLESAGAPIQFPAAYTRPETSPLKITWSGEETELDLQVPAF